RVASIVTDYFIEQGNSVDLVTFQKGEKSFVFNEKVNIKMLEQTKGIGKNFKRIMSIRKLIKKGKYDVIIGFAVIPSILSSIANIGLHYPVVVCERNDPNVYPKLWKLIRSFAY